MDLFSGAFVFHRLHQVKGYAQLHAHPGVGDFPDIVGMLKLEHTPDDSKLIPLAGVLKVKESPKLGRPQHLSEMGGMFR